MTEAGVKQRLRQQAQDLNTMEVADTPPPKLFHADNSSDNSMESPPPSIDSSNYFSCTQCNKFFWTESSLRHHHSLYHSEKAFVCETCGKAFRFRSNLAEHRSVLLINLNELKN